MSTYKHSVSLDASKCKGCTTCLKRCPTEAIRIRDGRAVINSKRCIDCGECIRVCPHKAKKAIHDSFSDLERYKYRIALPAPALYAQFDNLDDIGYVISGLLAIGFDDVLANSADVIIVFSKSDGHHQATSLRNALASCHVPSKACLPKCPFSGKL